MEGEGAHQLHQLLEVWLKAMLQVLCSCQGSSPLLACSFFFHRCLSQAGLGCGHLPLAIGSFSLQQGQLLLPEASDMTALRQQDCLLLSLILP